MGQQLVLSYFSPAFFCVWPGQKGDGVVGWQSAYRGYSMQQVTSVMAAAKASRAVSNPGVMGKAKRASRAYSLRKTPPCRKEAGTTGTEAAPPPLTRMDSVSGERKHLSQGRLAGATQTPAWPRKWHQVRRTFSFLLSHPPSRLCRSSQDYFPEPPHSNQVASNLGTKSMHLLNAYSN